MLNLRLATQTELFTLNEHSGWLISASFSPDGQRLVTASEDNTAKVWDATMGTPLANIAGHYGADTRLLDAVASCFLDDTQLVCFGKSMLLDL